MIVPISITNNNIRKIQTWKHISEIVGMPEQKCIKRWKSLRDKFAREMKISSESRWRYFKKMSFLVESIRQYRESLLGKCGPLPTTQTTTTTTTQVTQVESNQQQQQQHQQQQQTQPQSQQQQTQPQSQQQQTQRQPQPQTQQQQQQPQVQQQCLVDIFPFHGAATTSTQAVHHPHVTGDTQLTTVTTAPPKDQKSFYEPPMKRKRFDDEQQLQLQQQQQLLLQQQQQLQQHNDSMLNTINKFQNSLSQGVCPEDQSFGVAVTDMLNTLGVKQKAEAKVHIVKYLTDMKFLAQHRKF